MNKSENFNQIIAKLIQIFNTNFSVLPEIDF
jgi:hypothetical protein